MTGAYLFAVRDGERKPVEVEFLTTEERKELLRTRSKEELFSWLELTCKVLREIDDLGVIERVDKECSGTGLPDLFPVEAMRINKPKKP